MQKQLAFRQVTQAAAAGANGSVSLGVGLDGAQWHWRMLKAVMEMRPRRDVVRRISPTPSHIPLSY